jgi:hypothetical protein
VDVPEKAAKRTAAAEERKGPGKRKDVYHDPFDQGPAANTRISHGNAIVDVLVE